MALNIEQILNMYGEEAIRLLAKRHKTSADNRFLFNARRTVTALGDSERETEYTELMALNKAELEGIDRRLEEEFGITKKDSPSLIRTIKKEYQNDWYLL